MWNRAKTGAIDSTAKLSGIVILATMVSLLFAFPVTAHDRDEPGTSIKVHGDWVITVTNPDGSIAQESSFQNALVSPQLLIGELARGESSADPAIIDGLFRINQRGNPAVPDWKISVTTTGVNDILECNELIASDPSVSSSQPTDAIVSATTLSSFTLSRTLVLPITCVSGSTFSINSVRSEAYGFILYTASSVGEVITFTEKTLPAPITGIQPDQVVTLKATISFQ